MLTSTQVVSPVLMQGLSNGLPTVFDMLKGGQSKPEWAGRAKEQNEGEDAAPCERRPLSKSDRRGLWGKFGRTLWGTTQSETKKEDTVQLEWAMITGILRQKCAQNVTPTVTDHSAVTIPLTISRQVMYNRTYDPIGRAAEVEKSHVARER